MKILMIAPQPFFEPRGTPISVYQRLHGLSDLGHEIDLVTYHVGQPVDIPGVTIHRTPRLPFIKKIKVGPSLAKIPLDLLILLTSIYYLLRRRYDVIHSHEEAAFFSVVLAWIFRTRHLYDMHSSLPSQLDNFKFGNYKPIIKLFEMLERWVINTADVVLTIGTDLEEYVLKLKPGANHIRIENTAIHNTIKIDPEAAGKLRTQLKLDGRVAIVYTGTFERYQGLGLLFDSMALIAKDHPEAALVMVGGKPEQVKKWKDEARQRGISDQTVFVGTVPLEDSLVYLDMADVLVSPRLEGLSVPLKIYTYMQSGRPIVATDIPAHSIVLNDQIAVLTQPSTAAYAEGLKQLITEPAQREAIGRRAKAFAEEEFSKKRYLEKLNIAYESIRLKQPITEQIANETAVRG